MQIRKVDLFTFKLDIMTKQFDYGSLTDDLSSLPNTHIEIRDSALDFVVEELI